MMRWIRVALVGFVALAMAATIAGCESGKDNTERSKAGPHMMDIDAVIRAHSDSLMAIPDVVGLYHGLDEEGKDCLKIMVRRKTPDMERRLPKSLEGYRVLIEETGEIRPMK